MNVLIMIIVITRQATQPAGSILRPILRLIHVSFSSADKAGLNHKVPYLITAKRAM